jgi:transposase InsO family protein
VKNWERVIFSDESKFNLFGSDGLQYCWRKGGQALDPRYTQKQVKHGGGKVMVWGCISPHGVGRLCRIDGRMDSSQYISILQEGYLGTLKDLHTNHQGFIFQSDNDSKHKSRATQSWLRETGIPTLEWPSSSPDINIMENLWAYLDNRIRAHPMNLSNSEELWKTLQQEWYKISPKYIRKLYESLPRRVEEVCNVKGGNTKY